MYEHRDCIGASLDLHRSSGGISDSGLQAYDLAFVCIASYLS